MKYIDPRNKKTGCLKDLARKLTILAAFTTAVMGSSPTVATPCYYVDPAQSFKYGSSSSNQITKENLPFLDRQFLAQTGAGLQRGVGSVELIALVRWVAILHKQIPSSEAGKKQLAQDQIRQEIYNLGLSQPVSFALSERYTKFGEIPLDKLDQILTNIKNDFAGVNGYNGCH